MVPCATKCVYHAAEFGHKRTFDHTFATGMNLIQTPQ